MNPQDNSNFLKLGDLKEHRILLKSLIVFLPLAFFGLLAIFFPVLYAIFPVQESELCVCSFWTMYDNESAAFLIDPTPKAFATLLLVNTISFYVVNFVALLAMVIMVWRIRHTDDDTFLR